MDAVQDFTEIPGAGSVRVITRHGRRRKNNELSGDTTAYTMHFAYCIYTLIHHAKDMYILL